VDRKEMIRIAATELFAEQGFQATPTAAVAKRAGVSEGVIFYHFSTKEGILISLFDEIVNDFIAGVVQVLDEAPNGLEAVLGCVRLNSDMIQRRTLEMLVLVRDMPASFRDPGSPHRQKITENLERLLGLLSQAVATGQSDGTIRPCDPAKTAHLILGLMTGMSRQGLLGTQLPLDMDQEYMEFCRRALAAGQA